MHFLLKCLSSENSFSSEYLDFYFRKFNPKSKHKLVHAQTQGRNEPTKQKVQSFVGMSFPGRFSYFLLRI